MLKLQNHLPSENRQRIETATLNRGYDSADFLNALREMNIKPVIDNRKLRKGDQLVQYKNTDIYYSEAGEVFIYDRAIEERRLIQRPSIRDRCRKRTITDTTEIGKQFGMNTSTMYIC